MYMEYIFEDVLEIKNGKNQKAVENSEGQYPIYGSGGVMGYADDYICDSDTVIIGRKGSINNPIYVTERFWNVDTAFGLSAKRELLLPRYLFYFCKKFDFEKLNKTVTIPSLTKSDLLKIKIDLPAIPKQQEVVDRLSKIEKIIELRRQELSALDELVKARFVEMFESVQETCNVGDYIKTLIAGKSLAGETECENKILKTGAASFDYFDASQVKNLPVEYTPRKEHLVNVGDVIISRMNTAELTGAAAYVWNVPENVYIPDRLWKAVLKEKCNPIFVWQMLIQPSTKRQIQKECSGTSGSMKNISKAGMLGIRVKKVNIDMQNEFANFVKQIDKSKFVLFAYFLYFSNNGKVRKVV